MKTDHVDYRAFMGSAALRLVWAVDRLNDLINGSRRNARTSLSGALPECEQA